MEDDNKSAASLATEVGPALSGSVSNDELKFRSVRGGGASILGQGLGSALQLGSTIVLAQLLSPADYGLQGMILALTGFLGIFRDAGLSVATVQKENLTHEQTSGLFWVNFLVGSTLTVAVAVGSPLLVAFYREPRLLWPAAVSGTVFLLSSLAVQHRALLNRAMRFATVAKIDLFGAFIAAAVGIGMAASGFGYWALIAQAITGAAIPTVAVWMAMPWRPGPPRRTAGLLSMIRLGGTVTLNSFVVYLAYNAEKLLLGRYWGAEALGLYGRAYQLANLPIQQLGTAIGAVAFPVLCRLQDDSQRFCRSYLKFHAVNMSLAVPVVVSCALFPDEIIGALFGPKWTGAAPVLRMLAPAVLVFAVINSFSWVLFATGRAVRSLLIAVLIAPVVILGIAAGLRYGPAEVALGYSAAMVLLLIPVVAWAKHDTGITTATFWEAIKRPLACGVLGRRRRMDLQVSVSACLAAAPADAYRRDRDPGRLCRKFAVPDGTKRIVHGHVATVAAKECPSGSRGGTRKMKVFVLDQSTGLGCRSRGEEGPITSGRILRIAAPGLLVVLAGVLWQSRETPSIKWRTEVVKLKVAGALPDEAWATVLARITPGFGAVAGLDDLRLDAVGATKQFGGEGGLLFEHSCSGCHGLSGMGGPVGVSLASKELQSGLTDLDIYNVVTRGWGEMPPVLANVPSVLKLVGYVRKLGAEARSQDTKAACSECAHISVSVEDIAKSLAGSGEWLSYSGDYTGQRFAPYKQINVSNVSQLRPRFVVQTNSPVGLEAVPIIVNGVMIFTGHQNQVVALDVESGAVLWEYRRAMPDHIDLCCGRRNRGVAVLGNRVFHGTLDGRLVALDLRDGRELWNVEVVDYREGYSMTGAPLAVKDRIIVGVGGGDFGHSGVIDAFDPASGKRMWRFSTIPRPGQAGHETWPGDSWRRGGGATWVTGTYDPELNLVYWGVGNPSLVLDPASRIGDNLYTASVVALDAGSGSLRWHYQFVPNDGNDWDSNSTPVLVDAELGGIPRKLMLFANRNCFYYLLDRATGAFIQAKPFCEQNWNDGFAPDGRPIRRPGSVASKEGTLILPGVTGGANWMPPAYDRLSDIFVVKNHHGGEKIFTEEGSGKYDLGGFEESDPDHPRASFVTGIRGLTGEVLWEREQGGENNSGVLATAGGLAFTGDSQGHLVALDLHTGKELWKYRLGAQVSMAPVSYLHRGAQELVVLSGGSIFVFGCTRSHG